jgi:hypothetical protein
VQTCIEIFLFINSKAIFIKIEPHYYIEIYLTTIELTLNAMLL